MSDPVDDVTRSKEKNPRDAQGFRENPAPQGLKTPPPSPEFGEDSGEWPRGGGSDPSAGGTPRGEDPEPPKP
jgi:hypothetical protein